MKEGAYQTKLIKKLKKLLPGAIVLKNDSGYIQGIPDLLVLWKDKWAALEVKVSADAPTQPNQPYYVEKMDDMSYAAFVHPENESEVLIGIQQAFGVGR